MNKYDELTARLLERRDSYVAAQAAKRKRMLQVALPMSGGLLAAVIGIALWQGGVFENTPPVTDNIQPDTATTTDVTPSDTVTGDSTHTTADTTEDATAPTATVPTDIIPTVNHSTTVDDGTTADKTTSATGNPHSTTTTEQPTTEKTDPTTGTIGKPTKTNPTTSKPPVPTDTTVKPNNPEVTDPTTTTTTQPTTKPTSGKTDPTTQSTITGPSGGDPNEPLPPWPYLWIIYDTKQNYDMNKIPISFKLEGFEEVDLNWVKKTSYKTNGFSIVGDITVERDVETGGLIYRMVLAYDGVTPKPSFFFNVVSVDGIEQEDGLYGYLADHGFFIGGSYDTAENSSYYYLVETGVWTLEEYRAYLHKKWSESGVEWSYVKK